MAEIKKTAAIEADSKVLRLVEHFDELIHELAPDNSTAIWSNANQESDDRIDLRLSHAFSECSQSISLSDFYNYEAIHRIVSRLVGDLVYQQTNDSDDSKALAQLASFIPGRLCYRFGSQNPAIHLPSSEDASCAILFADISGFTSLTERLGKRERWVLKSSRVPLTIILES
jgi:hypothetical protein